MNTATTTADRSSSYASGPSSTPLLGETIGEVLARTVRMHGHREALVDRTTGTRWTYRELGAKVSALASGLLGLGIEKGDRVGIWAPNCPEWTLVQLATAEIGAILVTINPAYRREELEYVLNQAGVRLLVAAPRHKSSDYGRMVADAWPACPWLERVLLLGSPEWARLADRRGDVAVLDARRATLSPDDAINIQY